MNNVMVGDAMTCSQKQTSLIQMPQWKTTASQKVFAEVSPN